MSKDEFVREFAPNKESVFFQFATIDPLFVTGKPRLVFDGEISTSRKGYSYLKGYTPLANDRVVVINDIIIGAIQEVL